MKCVVIQDTRKLRPKDNKEANLGILEHFGHKNLGILEFMFFLRPQKKTIHRKGLKFVRVEFLPFCHINLLFQLINVKNGSNKVNY
jgi:hypothetical protein